jgi:hypothetical protein
MVDKSNDALWDFLVFFGTFWRTNTSFLRFLRGVAGTNWDFMGLFGALQRHGWCTVGT